MEKQQFAKFYLKDGSTLDLYRNEQGFTACIEDRCLILPHGTGDQAVQLYSLLESLSKKVEFPGEDESSEPTKD